MKNIIKEAETTVQDTKSSLSINKVENMPSNLAASSSSQFYLTEKLSSI
jgi:hypothetical protein